MNVAGYIAEDLSAENKSRMITNEMNWPYRNIWVSLAMV